MEEVQKELQKFRDDRDWKQFHTPGNIAKSIAIEAGELLEHFQWDNAFELDDVVKELADVANYCLMMADVLDVNLEEIMLSKIKENALKYPVEKSRGKSDKYTKL